MPESLKNGGLTLERIDIPESVNPGRSVTAKVTVSNDANWIDPFDDAKCQEDSGWTSNWGYHTTVVFTGPSGETQRESHCIETGNRKIFEFTFQAPSAEGETSANAKMVVDGNLGGETEEISQAFVVGTEDPAEEEVDYDGGNQYPWQDDGDDSNDDGGDSNPFSFGLELGKQEKAALGLVILLIAASVLRPYASAGATAAEVAT